MPFKPGDVKPGLPSQEGHVYHVTNFERAMEIAVQGLKTHRPWEGTDQDAWPDGSREKRSYFTQKAEHSHQFAPEYGNAVLLRTKMGPHIKRESTGDLYTTKRLHPKHIEAMSHDGSFVGMDKLLPDAEP